MIGAFFLAGGAASHEGLLDTAQDGLDKVHQAKGVWESFCDLAAPLFGHPATLVAAVVLIGAGVAVWLLSRRIVNQNVADYRAGVYAGAEG